MKKIDIEKIDIPEVRRALRTYEDGDDPTTKDPDNWGKVMNTWISYITFFEEVSLDALKRTGKLFPDDKVD